MRDYFKKLKPHKYLVVLFLLFSLAPILYAAEEVTPPDFKQLVEIVSRIVGLFLAASAAVLVIMIAYGIIKGSLAAGDPRGLEGAKSTWTYALYGFLVVVLSMVIIVIIRKSLELSTEDGSVGFKGFLEKFLDPILELIDIGKSDSEPLPPPVGYEPVHPMPQ